MNARILLVKIDRALHELADAIEEMGLPESREMLLRCLKGFRAVYAARNQLDVIERKLSWSLHTLEQLEEAMANEAMADPAFAQGVIEETHDRLSWMFDPRF